MSNPNTRKSCVVPKCTNTTTNSPEKLFFIVPMDVKMRKKWIKAMKRLVSFGDKSTVYCCEDHFDIENDMENYTKYKLVGGRIKLKQGIVPHKFKCQQEKEDKPPRSAVQKLHDAQSYPHSVAERSRSVPAVITIMNPDSVSAQVPDIADEVSQSTKALTTEVQTIRRKKTNAQKCREYRERKKLQNAMVQNIIPERSDECTKTDQLQTKRPKTNAERRKKYYEAQKLKKQQIKKIPKTVKQKNKEYYERKKKIQALNTLNHNSVFKERRGKPVCEELRKQIFCGVDAGKSSYQISKDLILPRSTVQTIIQHYKKNKTTSCLKKTDRLRADVINATAQKSDVEANSSKNEENADRADSRSDTMSASPVEHLIIKTENLYDYMEDMSMYEDDAACTAETDAVTTKEEESYHISQCSVCNEEITEFRYTCVQCSNFDLCSSCEMNRAHHHHYVLRVPHPTPNEEVESVLTVIRLHLLKDLDPIKEPKQEEIIIKMEEITVESEVQSELVEDDVQSEDMDKIIEARVPPQTTEQDMRFVDEFKCYNYKYCGVPLCLNTTVKTPRKLFITVPTEKSMRDKWLKLARRDPATLNPYTTFHFCEDHFDLPKDMENYMQYHVMGSVSQIRMKKGCVPTKFDCHPDWGKRPCTAQESYILEKRRKLMIQDCDSESVGSNSGHFIADDTTISKTAEKSTQVHLRYQFRSKAVQTQNKLVSRTTSPFRIIYKSVSTSPCNIDSLTDSKPYNRNSTKARKKILN